MERKFLVLLRRFSLRKEHYYFINFDCSFLRPHGETRRFLSTFCDSSKSCGFDTGRGNSKNMDCAQHKQILLCLTHPPIRAQIPAVFRRYYKTVGITPLTQPETNTPLFSIVIKKFIIS